jgi:hypothetical protein
MLDAMRERETAIRRSAVASSDERVRTQFAAIAQDLR